mmetsp:Transcript_35847/g.66843  ORF Transcript_35847/g.66843 Transcript_35847/m.66843 type:complete len:669 (+) Transcript_35847:2-2008(+)
MRMLRLMRILRLVKLVKSVRPLFILVTGVMSALQGVAWVLVLTIVTLYAMGILATSLIGKKMAFADTTNIPEEAFKPFSSVSNSMFTLFRVMSGAASDTEIGAIDILMDNMPVIKLGFVFFMITSSWTLLSILTAVVSDNMISTTGQQEEEIKMETAEEDRVEHVEKLKEIFNTIDINENGQVEQHEIEAFLADHQNAVSTARRCRVPVRDVREVLHIVAEACDGSTVSFDQFVDYLADVSNVVTEKSTMKIEAKIQNLSTHQSQAFMKLHSMLMRWEAQSGNHILSKVEDAVEKCSAALQNKAEIIFKSQQKEVDRLMQGLAERTEACLSQMQQKSQALEEALPKHGGDKLWEMLEVQLGRMQHELLLSMRGQAADISQLSEGREVATTANTTSISDQDLSSTRKEFCSEGVAGSSKDVKREHGEQPIVVKQNPTGSVDKASASSSREDPSAAQTEAQVPATEDSIRVLQENTDSMLRKMEGLLEKAADQRRSALAVDKFSETLESELRVMREEWLSCLGQQSSDVSTVRDESKAPLIEAQADLAGKARAPGVHVDVLAAQMEERLRATEESIYGLQQKTEAMLTKTAGLLEKVVNQGLSALALDKFSETLERELRTMWQQLLQQGVGSASADASASAAAAATSTLPPALVEGDIGSSPHTTAEREE